MFLIVKMDELTWIHVYRSSNWLGSLRILMRILYLFLYLLEYRYLQGLRPEAGVHSFFSEASGSSRAVQMDAPIDNTWPMMSSRSPSFPTSKSTENSIFQSGYAQHSFFGGEYASGETLKQEGQSLQPLFDEWPRTRESWTGLDDERSNQTSFSTTQLSISIPMASSDLSTTSSKSPHG